MSISNQGAVAMEATMKEVTSRGDQQSLLEAVDAITAPLARNMLHKIGLDETTTTPFKLLEIGCGMGVLAPNLNQTVPKNVMEKSSVLCTDFSEALVTTVKRRIENEGWVNTDARVVDAQDSGLPSESFTHVVSNLVYHVIPDSEAALKDSIRLLAPGGTLAFTTMHSLNGGWLPDVRAAFATFPTHLLPPDFHPQFHFPMQVTSYGHWYDIDWIRDTLTTDHQLDDVQVDVLANMYRIKGVEQAMNLFGPMVDMAADFVLGKECMERLGGKDGVRERVRKFLEGRYGERGWTMTGVSIVAWGRKPIVP